MDDDLYGDGNEPTSEKVQESDANNSESAILPKSILGGKDFKVGDEVVLKITGIHEDDVQVEYAPAKKSDKSEPKGDSEMASMYE